MFDYLKYFIKDPQVASIVPTRRGIAKAICRSLEKTHLHYIAEFGPGLGAVTKYLLRVADPQTQIFLFETNQDMCSKLRAKLNDPRLQVFNASAAEILSYLPREAHGSLDAVISGIPFSLMTPAERLEILSRAQLLLKPRGQMIIYQVIPIRNNIIGHDLRPELSRLFRKVKHQDMPLSLPPLRIYRAYK